MYQLNITCKNLAELKELIALIEASRTQSSVSATHGSIHADGHVIPPAPTAAVPNVIPVHVSGMPSPVPPVDDDEDGEASVPEFPTPTPPTDVLFNPQPVPAATPGAVSMLAPLPGSAMAPLLPASAPVAPAASPTQGGAIELDNNRFPWDERIHTEQRTKVKGDFWKYKRGVDKNLVAQVEEEFRRQGYGRPSTSTTQVPAPAAVTPVVHPSAPALPAMPAAPVIAAGPTADTLSKRFTDNVGARRVDANWVSQVLNAYGIKNIPDLANHPHRFVEIDTYLTQNGLL